MKEEDDGVKQIVLSLGHIVDFIFNDNLEMWRMKTRLIDTQVTLSRIWFVWGLEEVKPGKGPSIRERGVCRQAGIHICTEHVKK